MVAEVPRSQRLFSLLLALHLSSKGRSRDELRHGVLGYSDLEDQEFERLFSRDKAHLRDIGIEISVEEVEPKQYRYRLANSSSPHTQALAELSHEELAVLPLVKGLWDDEAEEFGAKLSAQFDLDTGRTRRRLQVRNSGLGNPQALAAFARAIGGGRVASFKYPDSEDATVFNRRELEPWKILLEDGRALVFGWDRQRHAPRYFAISRVAGEVTLTDTPATAIPQLSEIHTHYVAPVFWYRVEATSDLLRHSEPIESASPAPPGWQLRRGRPRPYRAWWADLMSSAQACCVVKPLSLREEILASLRHLSELTSLSQCGEANGSRGDA